MAVFNSTPYNNTNNPNLSPTSVGGPASSIQFNNGSSFAGTSLLGVSQQTSPVNGFSFTLTSTGAAPILKAIGNNTDVGINLQTKGQGGVDFTSSSGETLFKILNPVGVLDRYLFVAASDNTSIVEIGVDGSPTNASIQFSPKGNGVVNIAPTGSAASDVGEIRLFEGSNGAEYIGLKSPNSLTSAISYTLPATDGTNGDVLVTNGSGVLSFATVVGSNGASGLIQISDGSNGFTSDSIFNFDTTTNNLSVGLSSPLNKLNLHESTVSTPCYLQLTNNTSGSTSGDGILLGITGSGVAELKNQENSDLIFSTNGTEKLKIEAGGDVLPGTDELQNLGSISRKWLDIYGVNAQINTSDERHKNNIKNSELGLEFIKELKPVSYVWKKEGKRPHYGFISQDVKRCMNLLNKDFAGFIYDKESDTYGLRYSEFIAPIVKSIQELDASLNAKTALISPNQQSLKDIEERLQIQEKLQVAVLIDNLNDKIKILESKLKDYEKIPELIKCEIDKDIDGRIQDVIKNKKTWWNKLVDELKKIFKLK